jgi:signal transduction histidine kinase
MKKKTKAAKRPAQASIAARRDRVSIRKLPTGVRGLDEILGGGIPEFSFNVIAGTPGCGKTTLAHQIVFANATPKTPALYFTVLGEPAMKMLRYQQQYSFFDEGRLGRAIRFINLADVVLEKDLSAVLEAIVKEVTAANPAIVVVDSFRTVVRKAMFGVSELEMQSFIQRLAQFLTSWQATTFLVGEYAEGEIRDNPLFTVADGRAPLRAMQGYALLLLENNAATLDARSLEQLSRISTSAARLDALITDVLTYARLLRSEIVLQPVNVGDLVQKILQAYPELLANDAQILVVGELPAVMANEASLTQCFSNLLANAVKFVAPGRPARVRVYADEIGEDSRIWIEDEGLGIDPQNHARIWEIFTRVGHARDHDGTGIGLTIVRKGIERMKGSVGLESALGRGSRFWIRLRRA